MNNFTENDPNYYYAYQAAEKRVKAKIGFYWNLASYIIINTFLIGIYLITCWDGNNWNWSRPWFIWTLGSWGIGLVFHFLAIYIFQDNRTKHQKMIDVEMQRMGVPSPTIAPIPGNIPSGQTLLNPPPERPMPEPKRIEHK